MAGRIIDVTMQLINKVTQPLQGVTASLADSNKQWQRAGREITNTGRGIANVGQGLTTAITLPVAAAGTAAFNNFANVDKTLRLVRQTMGSTAGEAKTLESALLKAASGSVFSMQDAAEASLNFARAGFTAQQAADMVAPSFALAAGTATDLSTVTEGLGAVMKLYGADTSEAAHYADVFAQAQGQANTDVQGMFDAMTNAGSMFATVGWSVNDLAVATGLLGDALKDGSEAGNGLKSGLANLAGNDAATAMLEKLGVEVINDKGEFESFIDVQERLHNAFADLTQEEQVNAATALFGKNRMDMWLAIIRKAPSEVQGLTRALDDVDGKAQSMADALMGGAGGATESLASSLDALSYSIGSFLDKYATPVIKKITDLVDKFNALDDSTKDQIVKWAGIAAAVGPALLVFGKVTMGVGKLVTTIGKIGGAISRAGSLMAALATPGGIVIAVLAAIGIAIALVVTHWDQVKAAAQSFFNQIRPLITFLQDQWNELVTSLKSTWESHLKPVWEGFKNAVSDTWTAVQPILLRIAEIVKDVFEIKFKFAIEVAVEIFKFMSEFIGTTIETIVGVFNGYNEFVAGVFTADWDRAWNGIAQIFSSVWDGIKDVASATIDFISGLVSGLVDAWNGLLNIIGLAKDKSSEVPSAGSDGHYAVGTSFFKGGTATIHERGAEIVDLPRGSRIYPHAESLKIAYNEGRAQGGGGKGGTINITVAKLADAIQVRDNSDIEAIAAAIANKIERTAQNLGGEQYGYSY